MSNNGHQQAQSGLFGLKTTREDSKIIVMQVPWEVTTSYGSGASLGPEAILKASPQLDLFDFTLGPVHRHGIHLDSVGSQIANENKLFKLKAQKIIHEWVETGKISDFSKTTLNEINEACEWMTKKVFSHCQTALSSNHIPAILGGDHSTPLGLIKALSEKFHGDFGILHIDAHADLRNAYQGFQQSHASIMRNVMELISPPKALVQVGIRDFCQEEWLFIQQRPEITTFFGRNLKSQLFGGESWKSICEKIIDRLPENVYVSFDIDGLSPEFCPNTGTPVPGGMSFDQAQFLIETLGRSGRKIVGFDLVEVAPGENEWDGNVGARILYHMCGWALHSQGHLPLKD